MPADTLRENDEIVRALQGAINEGEHGLKVVPALLKRVICENRWQERHVEVLRREAAYEEFARFVEDEPPEGLGATIALLVRICADDNEAKRLIRNATVRPKGKHRGDACITSITGPAHGDASHAVSRLHDERPDLYQEVVSGRLSANAAAKQAGYRRPYASVRTDDPDKVSVFLAKHFDASEIKSICDLAIHERERRGI